MPALRCLSFTFSSLGLRGYSVEGGLGSRGCRVSGLGSSGCRGFRVLGVSGLGVRVEGYGS